MKQTTNNELTNRINALVNICELTDSIKSATLKKQLKELLKLAESAAAIADSKPAKKYERKDYGEFDPAKAKEAAKGLKVTLEFAEDGKHITIGGEDSKQLVPYWHQLGGRFYFKDKTWSFQMAKESELKEMLGWNDKPTAKSKKAAKVTAE